MGLEPRRSAESRMTIRGLQTPLTLRLSKNLPHDWKEQRRFLGFAA
jgi:hypothetical protein